MATLPTFEKLGLREPSPQAGAVGYRATSGLEEAPSDAAAKFGETVQRIAFEQQDALNATRAEDAWNAYKNTAMDLSVGKDGFAAKRAGAAVNGNLFKTYTGNLSEARKRIEAGLTDDDVRERFKHRANVTDLQFKDALLRHYTVERDAYEKQVFDGSMATATALVAADPMNQANFDTALLNVTRRAADMAAHQGITDKGELDKISGNVRDTLLTKRIDALLYSNPIVADQLFRLTSDQIQNPELRLQMQHKTREAALSVNATLEAGKLVDQTRREVDVKTRAPRAAGTTEVGFAGAVESLLKREGGYKASDGKSGAPVNFGINQRANPDIDVAKLTKDQAKAIYKTRYWDAIGGDNLPAGTALVALDAAALQGPEVAKKLIMDADGDPQTMIDIRRQQLTALAARDPEQAKYLPQWLKRLDGLQAEVSGMQNVAYHPDDPTAQNTSGLPNSRDLAAQLPMMEGKVDQRTNELYGADPTNPDWQAFNKRMKAELRAKVAADVQQLAAIQRQAQGTVIDAILGSHGGAQQAQPAGAMTVGAQAPAGAMVTSFSQIQANPDLMRSWQMLDPGVKPALLNLMNRNLDPTTGDVKLYRELFNRVHLEPGDPKKIDFYKQIVDPAIADRLSMQQIQSLRAEIDRNETPGGRSLNQMRKAADANVSLFFRTNIMFTAQPDRQIAATMKWNEDVGNKVDEYVKAGQPEKVRAMFMLDTPESVVSQKYLQTYVNSTPAQGTASGAAAVKAGTQQPIAQEPPVPQPASIDTREKLDAWFQTLPPTATTFMGTDGKVRAIPPRAAAPAPTAGYGARADGTQKGPGFLGAQPTTIEGAPKDQVSTEISVGVNIGGKNVEIPTMVPTLTKPELEYLLAGGDPRTNNAIMEKAVAHAKDRLAAGKSPFAAQGEQVDAPAPAAAALEDDLPKLEEAPAGPKGFRTQEQKDAQTARAEAGRAQMLGWLKAGIRGGIYVATYPLRVVAKNIVQMTELVPSEEERVVSAFRGMIKKGSYRATEDTFVLLNNFLASKKGTVAENAKAQKMVKAISDKLGIEQTPPEAP